MTIIAILILCALIATIISALGKCPLWVPVFILCFVEAVRVWPVGS